MHRSARNVGRNALFAGGALAVGLLAPLSAAGGNSTNVRVLADFDDAAIADRVFTVNDNVMGGRSSGGPSFEDGKLIFAGSTNTNGGGFSSIRMRIDEGALDNADGIMMRVRGDGRTYKAQMQTGSRHRGIEVAYWSEFQPTADEWRIVTVPFESYEPFIYGQPVSGRAADLDPNAVRTVGFLIYDGLDGPFNLEVDWIRTYRGDASDALAQINSSSAPDIVDTAINSGVTDMLVTAVSEAGLVDALRGEGPFTVLAPVDDAFEKNAHLVGRLLENKPALTNVLTYHVISGDLSAAALAGRSQVATLNGQRLKIAFDAEGLKINNARVIASDIRTSNGVIHLIDDVLKPELNRIPAVAQNAGSFKTLLAAAKAAGLAEALNGDGPFTVFAPTDKAFAALGDDTIQALLANPTQLAEILKYHVVSGRAFAADVVGGAAPATLQGDTIDIGFRDGALRVNESRIVATDVAAANGVIHVIDAVLLPPTASSGSSDIMAMDPPAAAMRLLELAVERGAPRYNEGQRGACADLYEVAMTACLVFGADLGDGVADALREGLEAGVGQDDTDRAWAYRRAMDRAFTLLSREMANAQRH